MPRTLIVPAAGLGSRLGAARPKLLVRVAGTPMIDRKKRVLTLRPRSSRSLVATSRPMSPALAARRTAMQPPVRANETSRQLS